MMHIHYSPIAGAFRIYLDDTSDGYENRRPYDGIITVQFLADDTVYLSGAHGTINREVYTKLTEKLRELGVKRVLYERHGTMVHREL